jgi:ankyrin repeat protein
MTNKRSKLEELKIEVFDKKQDSKQNRNKLFKLAKIEDDIKTITRLATELKFKNAINFLNKRVEILFNNINEKSIQDAILDGLNINITDNKGATFLHYATVRDNRILTKFLINNNANINAQDKDRATPLLLASKNGFKNIVKMLLENNALPNLQNNYGDTAIMRAAYENHFEIVKLLVKNGANLNIKAEIDGATALMMSVQNKHFEITKFLIENGADINIINKNNETALNIALGNLDYKISKLLLKNNAIVIPTFNNLTNNDFQLIKLTQKSVLKFNKELKKNIQSKEMATTLIQAIINYEKIEEELFKDYQLNLKVNKYEKNIINEKMINFLNDIYREEINSMIDKNLIEPFGYKIIFIKQYINIIMQAYSIGIYKLDQFKNIEYSKYDNPYLYRLLLTNQSDGKVIVDIYEKTLLHTFENKDRKRYTVEYKKIFENKYYDRKYGYIMIIDNYLVEKPLKGGARISEFNKLDEFNNIVEFNNEHNPKALIKILNLFTQDNPIKYAAHSFEWSKYKTYDNFMCELKKAFDKEDESLKKLSQHLLDNDEPNLYTKISKFLFDENLDENNTWGMSNISFGWSSLELKEWSNKEEQKENSKKAISFELPAKYHKTLNKKTISTFDDVCDIFKNEIEIREDNRLKILLDEFEDDILGFDFEIEYKNIEGVSFYTDVENFKYGLKLIFEQFAKRKEYDQIIIEAITDNKNYVDITLTQKDSKVLNKNSYDFKNEIKCGDFSSIKHHFTSLCDWSIEATFKDGDFRIDYLSIDSEDTVVSSLATEPIGFAYILRFFNK